MRHLDRLPLWTLADRLGGLPCLATEPPPMSGHLLRFSPARNIIGSIHHVDNGFTA